MAAFDLPRNKKEDFPSNSIASALHQRSVGRLGIGFALRLLTLWICLAPALAFSATADWCWDKNKDAVPPQRVPANYFRYYVHDYSAIGDDGRRDSPVDACIFWNSTPWGWWNVGQWDVQATNTPDDGPMYADGTYDWGSPRGLCTLTTGQTVWQWYSEPHCPKGYSWNSYHHYCQFLGDTAPVPVCQAPTCPTGQTRDPITGQCKPEDPPPCPDGQTPDPITGQCQPDAQPVKTLGPQPCGKEPSAQVGHPIDTRTGNKLKVATDYVGAGPFPLQLTRTYNSLADTSPGPFGVRWSFAFGAHLKITASAVAAVRGDGKVLGFRLTGSAWMPDADVDSRLQVLGSNSQPLGWTYVDEEDRIESYDASGKLLSVTNRFGLKQTYSYDAAGRLVSVADPFGRNLSFAYDAQNRIVAATDPAGGVYRYGYDADGNLATVTDPIGAVQGYLYAEVPYPPETPSTAQGAGSASYSFPRPPRLLLAGIVDELGRRYATYSYDDQGRAVSSQLAGGADKVTVSYPDPGKQSVVTDTLGTARTYRYDTLLGVPHITSISQPCAACGQDVGSLTYDANGNVLSRPDFMGVTTTYRYDTARNLETRRTEAAGTAQERTITTEWHPGFRLPVKITGPDGVRTFAYDDNGRLIRRTASSLDNSQSRTWRYAYNAQGLIAQVDGPRLDVSDVTAYDYDAQGNLATVTDAVGHATRITAYDAHGRPLTVVDPNGLTTQLAYDAKGRLLSQEVGGEVTRYAYDAAGQLVQVSRPDGAYLQYSYDAAHRLIKIQDNHGDQIAYTLDALGNRIQEAWQDPDGALAKTLERQIDALNRLAALTGAQGQRTRFQYDDNGQLESVTDPLGHSTRYGYDALDRLIASTDPAGAQARYGYDAAGRLSAVSDRNGNTTRYGYDGLGNPISTDSPDAGLTQKQFDDAGNPTGSLDARGIQTHYGYDADNRLTAIDYPNDPDVHFTYDEGPNALGRLSRLDDASGSTQWQYDAHGRVTQKTQSVDGVSLSLAYSYDSTGRLTQITYPSGAQLFYQYDAERLVGLDLIPSEHSPAGTNPPGADLDGQSPPTGQRTGKSAVKGQGEGKNNNGAATGPQTLLSQIRYNALGQATGWTWGNGAAHTRQYDPDGRPQGYPLGAGSRTLGYDAAGQITGYRSTATQSLQAASALNQSQSFAYDIAGRLLGAANPGWQLAYTDDANGNRSAASATDLAAGTTSTTQYHYTLGSNRLDSAATAAGTTLYQFDPAGHTTDDGKHRYRYNDAGRLSQADKAQYRYNGIGQRVAKTVPGQGATLFVYDRQGQLIGEYGPAGQPIQETVYLGHIPVAVLASGAIYRIHADHLNAPRVIQDAGGKIVWTWNSDPYGNAWDQTGPTAAHGQLTYNLRFPGQYYDRETGLHYSYFRTYDPATGRYLESDPIGLLGGLNTYTYAYSNPLTWIDPLGLRTAVVVNGPTAGNPIGHTAIAFPGSGTYSYGNNAYGMNLTDYVTRESPRRNSTVIIIDTTPEQERRMMEYLEQFQNRTLQWWPDNCADRTSGALNAGGMRNPYGIFPSSSWPDEVMAQAELWRQVLGGEVVNIPRNSNTVPEVLREFDRR